jgi:hypothetical protein
VVIDWPGAARGARVTDVALTWVLMAAGEIPSRRVKAALLGWARGLLIDSFPGPFDLEDTRPHLAEVVAWWRLVRSEGGET